MDDMITIPRQEYERLRTAAEDLVDLLAYDRAIAALDRGAEELIPEDFATRLLNGANALRVFRELRGYTQDVLAMAADVTRATIGEIEIGRKQSSDSIIPQLAKALNVTVDDLIS